MWSDYQRYCYRCLAGQDNHELPHRMITSAGLPRTLVKEIYREDIMEDIKGREDDFEGLEPWRI